MKHKVSNRELPLKRNISPPKHIDLKIAYRQPKTATG